MIQSPLVGEITPAEILAKLPANVDKVYVRVDQNKAYRVKSEESGSVDLWLKKKGIALKRSLFSYLEFVVSNNRFS